MSTTSNDNEPASLAELKAENLRLAESLDRCHALVASYRVALRKAGEGQLLLKPDRSGRP